MPCTAAFHDTIYVAAAAVNVTKINDQATRENSRSGDRKKPGYSDRFNTSAVKLLFSVSQIMVCRKRRKTNNFARHF